MAHITQACMTAQTYHQLKHGNEVRQALSGQREAAHNEVRDSDKMVGRYNEDV